MKKLNKGGLGILIYKQVRTTLHSQSIFLLYVQKDNEEKHKETIRERRVTYQMLSLSDLATAAT